jgi:hypothetical protein
MRKLTILDEKGENWSLGEHGDWGVKDCCGEGSDIAPGIDNGGVHPIGLIDKPWYTLVNTSAPTYGIEIANTFGTYTAIQSCHTRAMGNYWVG